jgi:hypothetical protein
MLENKTELQPPSWFLTPEEITAARNGSSRGLRPYPLQGNSVELFVNGDEVFKALYDDLSKTQSGDFIWMTGWDIDGAVMLLPDPSNPEKASESRIDAKYWPKPIQLYYAYKYIFDMFEPCGFGGQ